MKIWHIYTVEYYSAVKLWNLQVELKIVIVSEGTQTQKDQHHIFSLKCESSVSLLIFWYVCLNRSTCIMEEIKNAPDGSEI